MKLRYTRNEKGVALLTALILLFVLGALGSTFMMLVTTNVRISSNQAIASRLLFFSEAGISEALSRLASGDTTLMDTSSSFQVANWRAEIHKTRDDDSTDGSGTVIVYRSPTRQTGGDTLPYVSEDHHVNIQYLRDSTGDSIVYFNTNLQKRDNYVAASPPVQSYYFPIVQIRSTARRGGMERTITVETTMKKTNPEVEGALNFGGNAEFTGSPITFYSSGAVINNGTATPLIKRETTAPFDIYVDKDEDNIFDRIKVKTDSTEWGFYSTWATGPDSGREYKWNLDRLPFDARIDQFGVVGTDWKDYPTVSFNPSEFTEEGDLIANGNIFFYKTPRIHGAVKAHGEVSLTEDTLSYVTGEILTEQPPKALIVVDFKDTVRWKDFGYTIVLSDSLGSGTFSKWEYVDGDAHYRGGTSDTNEGKFYFADMDVVIDSILLGIVYITTPGNVTIYNDLTVPFELSNTSKSSLILAQYNITLANDSLFVRAGLQSQLGNLVVEGKNPVIHGYVMVGGSGTIDKDLVIVLNDVYRDPFFSQWALFKKFNIYNITTLSWREMN